MFLVALLGSSLSAVTPSPLVPIVVTATRPMFRGPVVPDRELGKMRGGVLLPNGLFVSIGIDIQTRVDGLLALHTVYASDGSDPGIRVYTDGAKPVPIAPTTQTITTSNMPGIPEVIVDRSATGTTITPGSGNGATTVNLVNGDPSTWLSGEGQTQLPVSAKGPPVATSNGEVTLQNEAGNAVVELKSDTLDVRHLIGQATGVVIANTANNRAIDTVSSVNVDLQGLNPGLIGGLFAAQRMVLESTGLAGH